LTEGVTVIVADIGIVPVFEALKPGIFPEPLAPIPMAVFEFVQVKVPPVGVLTKLVAETVPLLQIIMFAGTVTVGVGFTVIV